MHWSRLSWARFVGVLLLSPLTLHSQHPLLASHLPNTVLSGRASIVGYTDSKQSLQLAIALPLHNEQNLHQLLTQLYSPASPLFHQYLSVKEFADRYGATQQEYEAVVAWAQSKGLHVKHLSQTRRLVDVDGSVEIINAAFHIAL